MIQFAEDGNEPDAPVKSSLQARVQPVGVGGTEALAARVSGIVINTAAALAPKAMRHRRAGGRLGAGGDRAGIGMGDLLVNPGDASVLPFVVASNKRRMMKALSWRIVNGGSPCGHALAVADRRG
jgi:hypothetical protein